MHPDYTLAIDFDSSIDMSDRVPEHDYQVDKSGFAFDVEDNMQTYLQDYLKQYRKTTSEMYRRLRSPKIEDTLGDWNEEIKMYHPGMPGKSRDPIR